MIDYAPEPSLPPRPLGTLRKGDRGVVMAVVDVPESALAPGELADRLLEMGFIEGAQVEILHEGPVGRDPVGIRLHDCVIALRRQEANAILIGA